MENLKIGVVEDDFLIAESISETLQRIGYRPVGPARSHVDALQMIERERPDLLLVDIALAGGADGIELASVINKEYGVPFIFLTAYSDPATLNRAKDVKPCAYLVKPFNENDLFSSIEIAFSNYNRDNQLKPQADISSAYLSDIIFIKEGDLFHKVEINDILYIESDNVYLNIYTAKKHFLVRARLDDFVRETVKKDFIKVHRSYAVNIKHLETINSLSVKVAGRQIPLHKSYRHELLQVVQTLK